MIKKSKKPSENAEGSHVTIHSKQSIYSGFFSVDEYNISFRKFDGTQTDVLNRSSISAPDAVIVLPYDPINDRILLVEQFRMGPFVRGDANPWVLEPIAGVVNVGETPEQAGFRESLEEANLELRHLELVTKSYSTPGISSEFFHQYIGIVTLPENSSLVAGLASENEDIRSHIFDYERFFEMVESGEIKVGPLILLALWLAKNRPILKEKYSSQI